MEEYQKKIIIKIKPLIKKSDMNESKININPEIKNELVVEEKSKFPKIIIKIDSKKEINDNNLNIETKICSRCQLSRNVSEFNRRLGKPISPCFICINEEKREKIKKKIEEEKKKKIDEGKIEEAKAIQISGIKKCSKCHENKDILDFHFRNGKSVSQCYSCINKHGIEYDRKKRDEIKKKKIEKGEIFIPKDPENNFICNDCHQEKLKKEFGYNRKVCNECSKRQNREYRRSEWGKEKSRIWNENNNERMTELQSHWYQNNKEKRNKEYNERYHSDPLFKFKCLCKRRIQVAFKNKNLQKSNKTIKYLNCDISFLIEWFKLCFDSNMTLENHGIYWHMDHVIPVNTFDLTNEEDVLLCFSWFNLSPLNGSENMSKHDSIVLKQISIHIQKLKEFINKNNTYIPEKYFNLCAKHFTMTGKSLEI